MIRIIDKFYDDLQAKFKTTINGMIASLVMAGDAKKLVDDWDNIMNKLSNYHEDLTKILSSPDEEAETSDYIQMAALYIIYAIMSELDERFEVQEEI